MCVFPAFCNTQYLGVAVQFRAKVRKVWSKVIHIVNSLIHHSLILQHSDITDSETDTHALSPTHTLLRTHPAYILKYYLLFSQSDAHSDVDAVHKCTLFVSHTSFPSLTVVRCRSPVAWTLPVRTRESWRCQTHLEVGQWGRAPWCPPLVPQHATHMDWSDSPETAEEIMCAFERL